MIFTCSDSTRRSSLLANVHLKCMNDFARKQGVATILALSTYSCLLSAS